MQQSRHNTELTIKADEEELEQLECIQFFGLYVVENLPWSIIVGTILKIFHALKRISKMCNTPQKIFNMA